MGFFEPEQIEKPTEEKTEKKEENTSQPVVEATEELSTEAQLVQLAKDNKTTVDELSKRITKIKDEQKLGDKGAVAVLKSELTGFARSTQTKEFVARVIAVEGSREMTSKKDQTKYLSSFLDFFIVEDGKTQGVSMNLTNKNADLYKKFWPIGDVFKFTCGYYTDRNKALRLTVGDDGKLDVVRLKADDPLAKSIPTFQEIAKSKVQHLNQLSKYVGQTAVFSGILSKHIARQDGTYMGIEVSDGTVFKPIACFLAEPLLSAMDKKRIPIGTELWLYGYVGQNQDGEARISPRGIYPPV